MSHDKTKAAARKRMAATGEPYTSARRQATEEYNMAHGTSPVSPEDIQAAAAVHRELGPDYSDAVVASFIDKVDRAVAARVEARLADLPESQSGKRITRGRRLLTRRVARDVLAASAGALMVVGAVGLHDITASQPKQPASGLARYCMTTNSRACLPGWYESNLRIHYLRYPLVTPAHVRAAINPRNH